MHCIVIVIGIVGRGVHTNRSRVATFGRRRGELPAELGVFFREALQLRGGVVDSVFNAINAINASIVIIVLSAFGIDVIIVISFMLVLTVGRIE